MRRKLTDKYSKEPIKNKVLFYLILGTVQVSKKERKGIPEIYIQYLKKIHIGKKTKKNMEKVMCISWMTGMIQALLDGETVYPINIVYVSSQYHKLVNEKEGKDMLFKELYKTFKKEQDKI